MLLGFSKRMSLLSADLTELFRLIFLSVLMSKTSSKVHPMNGRKRGAINSKAIISSKDYVAHGGVAASRGLPLARPNKSLSTSCETLSERLFGKLAIFIKDQTGICMLHSQNLMLSGRLANRMRALGLESLEHYADYLFSLSGRHQEMPRFIDAVTTNKTEFFREKFHFDYLGGQGLHELTKTFGNDLMLWSAPVSEGHEAYTLAMVLDNCSSTYMRGLRYSVLGIDLSESALKRAKTGIYQLREVEPVPDGFRKKYLMKKETMKGTIVRVMPELRDKVSFQKLNLMEDSYDVPLRFRQAHVVFCRNLLIYFDKETKEQVVRKLAAHLAPDGLFFSGASEPLTGMDVPLERLDTSIYRKMED